jgi:hypothetical protein
MSIVHGDVGLEVELVIEKIGATTRLRSLTPTLVWTERADWSRREDFRIIPEDTIPTDLTPYGRQRMTQAFASEKQLLRIQK